MRGTPFLMLLLFVACGSDRVNQGEQIPDNDVLMFVEVNENDLLNRAEAYLLQAPVPITAASSPRSQGGIHDFYSEGDYWWPDPDQPDGPYIRRDGESNPDNFVAHRQAMRKLNQWVAALVAAYKLSGDERFAAHAVTHLLTFFVDPATRMNPNLLYAQAIKGRVSGRGIGIIDTIHLIEIVRAIEVLAELDYLEGKQLKALKDWFASYGQWLNTHEYGIDEKNHGNNHSTWWAAQVAAFGRLTGDAALVAVAREQFKKLLAEQMAEDGSFPDELARTKPYSYSLFNLEGYAVLAEFASVPTDNLWTYDSPNGSLKQAWDFMLPAVKDKSQWTYPPDVQHFSELPIQSPGMLFAARAYQDEDMVRVWSALDPVRKSEEINRTYPIREPVLWQ